MEPIHHIDPFHGNGAIDLPTPEGIAASWFFIKAQTGNTHPGACLPFGMVSACSHSGAYVTGYGLNAPNSHARPPKRFETYCASGMAHFHQSGTGDIRNFYNYALVTPLLASLESLGTRWRLLEEEARPGYYATRLENGILAELTVSAKAALHRYTFPTASDARIAIDVSAGGIDFPERRTFPSSAQIQALTARTARARVCMAGFPLYMYVMIEQEVESCEPWLNQQTIHEPELELVQLDQENQPSFGLLFDAINTAGPITLRIGFSFRSYAQAEQNMRATLDQSFDDVAQAAYRTWQGYADRVQIDGGSDKQRSTFYSCLYHALAKPADLTGESPFWQDAACYVDFATMWDMYKTQLPLMLSIYPDRGVDAVNALLNWAEHAGAFPNAILLNQDLFGFEKQARGLAHHTIADAFHRRLPGINWQHALKLMLKDIHKARNSDFLQHGVAHPYTHTLDLADACACTAWLARDMGNTEALAELNRLAANWRNVYDPTTGRLGDSHYYEGGPWNYSFRLLHDMRSRISLYPTDSDFVAELDRFFGYGQPPVQQPVVPGDRAYMQWGFNLNRFEGYNNEPDIETPYSYIYAGRQDRTAEIVRAGMRYMFTTGRGGLPGNDDSGGLSSCHVWNALGLFPVAGQPIMLIGSPLFNRAAISWLGNPLTIDASNNSQDNIYVQSAQHNGKPLDRAYLTMDELQDGGTIQLVMGSQPSGWARQQLPPSWTEIR